MNEEKALRLQKAMDYIVYMIVGSYFDRAECVSKIREEKLFLNYKEIGVEKQIKYENVCINYVENILMRKLPEQTWNRNVRVLMKPEETGERTSIYFVTDNFKMSLTSDITNPSRPKLSCTINGQEVAR